MKIKTMLNNKKLVVSAVGGLVVLSLAGGGVYLSQKESTKMSDNSNQQVQNQSDDNKNEKVINNVQNGNASSGQENNSSQPAEAVQVSPSLNDVTLQGNLFDSSGSISVSLYGGPGKYTIEKEVNGAWVNVASDQNYAGTGGLAVNDTIPVSELSRNYRIFRTVDGVKSQVKEITVDRNLIKDGSASFPEAL